MTQDQQGCYSTHTETTEGEVMSDFKIGDKIRRIDESNVEVFKGAVYKVRGLTKYGDLELAGLDDFGYNPSSFELVAESYLPTYTYPEQLSEIDELQDRVEYLESLCSDYVEQIKDIEYALEAHKKALNKFTKLTVLLSENHKVADLVGSQIGDDVVDKIYDYLLSQVKQKTDFKPISEMTIGDWQQALDEGWEFEDNEEDICQVESVDKERHRITFDEYLGEFDVKGNYVDNHPYYITKRIK